MWLFIFSLHLSFGMDTEEKGNFSEDIQTAILISKSVFREAQGLWVTVADPFHQFHGDEKREIQNANAEMMEELGKVQRILHKYQWRSFDPKYFEAQKRYSEALEVYRELIRLTSRVE